MTILKKLMYGMGFKGHKIFRPIIFSDSVDMMTYFPRFKIAANLFFYNKAMFKNIIFIRSMRMSQRKYQNISNIIVNSSTLPLIGFRTSFSIIPMISSCIFFCKCLALSFSTFFRMSFSVFVNATGKIKSNLSQFFFRFFSMFKTNFSFSQFIFRLRSMRFTIKSIIFPSTSFFHFLNGFLRMFRTFFHTYIITNFVINLNQNTLKEVQNA